VDNLAVSPIAVVAVPDSARVPEPVPMLDLSRQYEPIRDEILAALAEVVDRQQFIRAACGIL